MPSPYPSRPPITPRVIFGRAFRKPARTVIAELGFWPPVADDPSATPDQREISRLDTAIEKVVVSDSLTEDQTDPWRDTTRIVRRADAHAEVAALKERSGKDILTRTFDGSDNHLVRYSAQAS